MKIAIAQTKMAWTTDENTATILDALRTSATHGAAMCVFPELAVTGFHRRIREEARPENVCAALRRIRACCESADIAAIVGTPTFNESGIINAVEFIDRRGAVIGHVEKIGITPTEATFLQTGSQRPILEVDRQRCTAIVCREVNDVETLTEQIAPKSTDLIFWPGIMRPDPEKSASDEPHIDDACVLAQHACAYVIQSNWPNSLNYPEESAEQGHSIVISPLGEIMFRLPKAKAGIGVFSLGESTYRWIET